MRRSKSWRIQKKKQLFFLMRELSDNVQNVDDFGILAGYTLVDSLSKLNLPGEESHVRSQAIRSVYEGLDRAIIGVADEGFDPTFASVRDRVNTELGAGQIDTSAVSIDEILNSIEESSTNYEQELRTKGLVLYERVTRRGPLRCEKRDCLVTDFRDLYQTFTGHKYEPTI